MTCGMWPLVAIYAIMVLSFAVLFTIPFYFLDRADRRLDEGRQEAGR